ncbi:hypothetical protein GDO78_013871, partial [Eleutherodactylus coqui]
MDYISKKINQFGVDLSNELRRSESDKNRLFSPLSISKALSLMLLGSTGDTAAQIEKEYVRSAEELYQAKVKTVDFGEDKTRQEINSWVEEKTDRKIKDLFPENSLDKSSSLILVDAVYFKGLWKKKFNEKNTINAPFYLTKDSQKSVPMMSQTGKFNVGAIDEIDALIIELPYEANDLSMFMILPNETDGLQK